MDITLILEELRKERMLALQANADLSYTLGIYYGYPHCCRKEYCNDIVNNRNPGKRNIDGSGFIPCSIHYNEIRQNKINIHDLIINRICPIPFK